MTLNMDAKTVLFWANNCLLTKQDIGRNMEYGCVDILLEQGW